jgi:pSer/pThr/pTyr-binding forkhead associated (FHA) protein
MRASAENKVSWVCCDPHPPVPLNLKTNKKIIIGRHKNCDLRLLHSCVSRNHAAIRVVSGRALILEDLNSSNGTFVNGKKVTTYPLEVGDIIQIGPFEVDVRNEPFNTDASKYGTTNTEFLTTNRTAAMAGQIEKTPIVEVLQSIEFNGKTGTLYVETKRKDGFFVFASGRPISAIFGEESDVAAILAMLKLSKGNFILTDKVEPIDNGINCTITTILFEFSKRQDEESHSSSSATSLDL